MPPVAQEARAACALAMNPGATNIEQPSTTAAIFELSDLIDVGRTRMDEPFAVGGESKH